MKIKIFISMMAMTFIVGCGGGSGDSTPSQNTSEEPGELQKLSNIYKDSIIEKIQNTNFINLMEDTNALSKDNYVAYYKRMNALRFVSIPDLNITFDLKKDGNITEAMHTDRYAKVIYKSIWSRKDEYTCRDGGIVSKEVTLSPRDKFDADTYRTGDDTKYFYDRCDMGDVTYSGKVAYHVGISNSGVNKIAINTNFGITPLGVFDSHFNAMSMETETQKITLNGTIRFDAKASMTPAPSSKLISLEKKYYTVGDFTVTVYDKTTGETIKLIYNGTLDKVTYRDTNGVGDTNASVINLGVIGKFTYRRTSDYLLRVERDGAMFTLKMFDNISGLTGTNGDMEPPRPIGYDYSNASSMSVSNHTIKNQLLADGTSRYILDMYTDLQADANEIVGIPQHTLPLSDVDLMKGVVIIGFDTCPPTNRLRKYFDELNIEYNYINMKGTEKAYNVFKWFNIFGVPYVGINGNFFGGAAYNKNHFATFFNLHNYEIDKSLIDEAYKTKSTLKSATIWFKESFDDLQTKEKHTAMAVANDTPYAYQRYRAWGWDSVQKAKDYALKKCEETRKTRKDRGKKELYSKCRLYSIDGVIQSQSVVRSIP